MLGVMLIALMIPLLSLVSVQAEINANEQSVIDAASGTFYYDGQYYTAAPDYMTKLVNKLDGSDVNLSTADANTAITQIYSRIGEGVEKGYIIPTSSSATEGNTQAEPTGTPDSSDPQVSPTKKPGSSGNGSGTSPEISTDVSGNPIPDGVVIANEDGSYVIQGEGATSTEDTINNQIEDTDSLQKEEWSPNQGQSEMIANMPKEEEALISMVLNSEEGELYVSSTKPLSEVLESQVSKLFVVILILLVTIIIMFGITTATGCGRWQKNRGSQNREYRRRIRHIASIGSATIASLATVVFSYAVGFMVAGHIKGDASIFHEAASDNVQLADYQSLQDILTGYSNTYLLRIMLYGFLLLIASIALIVMGQSLAHRGVRYIRYGATVGGILTLGVTVVVYFANLFGMVHTSPSYLYLYWMDYIQNGLLIVLILAFVFIAVSIALYPLEKYMRKKVMRHG